MTIPYIPSKMQINIGEKEFQDSHHDTVCDELFYLTISAGYPLLYAIKVRGGHLLSHIIRILFKDFCRGLSFLRLSSTIKNYIK